MKRPASRRSNRFSISDIPRTPVAEDPILRLQHLLDDPSNLLERISRIQSVIGSIAAPETDPPAEEHKQNEIAPYEDLSRLLRDMQIQIDQHVRPSVLRAVETEVERLRAVITQERIAGEKCLAQLDNSVLACISQIGSARKIYADLEQLNERLQELGAPPERLPECYATLDPGEVLQTRIDELRRQTKL